MSDRLFPEGAPSLQRFARDHHVAASTFRRVADWLLALIPGFLASRRPGPALAESSPDRHEAAVKKLTDLYRWLQDHRQKTEKNACYVPEAKQRIAAVANEIRASGALSFAEIAEVLELNERQLRRIRRDVERAGGLAPQSGNRRPHRTLDLAEELQVLIRRIQISADTRRPYTAADIRRILEKNYQKALRRYHDSETISEDTVRKYMHREPARLKREHPRGSFVYPEPFLEVAIDTSCFTLFGITFYLITVFEFGARLNLVTRLFLRENTGAVVKALEEYLLRFGGIGVVVIDRGSPYLNQVVKSLLEKHGKIRLVSPVCTPTAKAACERHFGTLKPILRAALESVLPQDPGWPREWLAKLIEMGIAVFQPLYHRIPQDGIDGKSPAERADEFDGFRAWSQMVELFERAMRSEPVDEIAGEIHDCFQLPGPKEQTVARLRHFGGRVLRRVLETLRGKIGPPHPTWLRDPLGYVSARAKEIAEREFLEYFRKQRDQEEQKQRDEDHRSHRESVLERREHPERFVDETLTHVIRFLDMRIPSAARVRLRDLAMLLDSLAVRLGRAFESEIGRLIKRVRELTENHDTRRRMHEWLQARASPAFST